MDQSLIHAFVDEDGGIIALTPPNLPAMPLAFLERRLAVKFFPYVMGFMKAKFPDKKWKLLKYKKPVDITQEIYKECRANGLDYEL